MFISIKTNVIVILIFATLLPIALLRAFMYPLIQSDFKSMAMDNLEVIGHKQTELVTTWMHEKKKNVIVISANHYMVNSVNTMLKDSEYQKTVQYLNRVVAEYGYKEAFVCNNKGVVTLATSEDRVGKDISKMDFFQQVIREEAFVSSIIPSDVPLFNGSDEEGSESPSMFIASPLKDKNGAIIGVVASRVHVKILSNLIQILPYGKTDETYLVNKDTYLLAESRFIKELRKTESTRKRSAFELKQISTNPCMIRGVNVPLKVSDHQKLVRYLNRIVDECGYKEAFVCNNKGVVTFATSEDRVGKDTSEMDYL